MDMFSSAKTLIQANQKIALQVNSISDIKKIIKDLKWYFRKNEYLKLQYSHLSTNCSCLTKLTADKAYVLRLVDALAIYIKQEQAKVKKLKSTFNKRYKDYNSS